MNRRLESRFSASQEVSEERRGQLEEDDPEEVDYSDDFETYSESDHGETDSQVFSDSCEVHEREKINPEEFSNQLMMTATSHRSSKGSTMKTYEALDRVNYEEIQELQDFTEKDSVKEGTKESGISVELCSDEIIEDDEEKPDNFFDQQMLRVKRSCKSSTTKTCEALETNPMVEESKVELQQSNEGQKDSVAEKGIELESLQAPSPKTSASGNNVVPLQRLKIDQGSRSEAHTLIGKLPPLKKSQKKPKQNKVKLAGEGIRKNEIDFFLTECCGTEECEALEKPAAPEDDLHVEMNSMVEEPEVKLQQSNEGQKDSVAEKGIELESLQAPWPKTSASANNILQVELPPQERRSEAQTHGSKLPPLKKSKKNKAKLSCKVSELTAELEAHKKMIGQLEARQKESAAREDQLASDLEEKQTVICSLQKNQEVSVFNQNEKDKEVQSLTQKNRKLASENIALRDELDAQKALSQRLQNDLDKFADGLKKDEEIKSQNIQTLRTDVEDRDRMISLLQEDVQKLALALEKEQERSSSLQRESEQLDSLAQVNQDLVSEIERLNRVQAKELFAEEIQTMKLELFEKSAALEKSLMTGNTLENERVSFEMLSEMKVSKDVLIDLHEQLREAVETIRHQTDTVKTLINENRDAKPKDRSRYASASQHNQDIISEKLLTIRDLHVEIQELKALQIQSHVWQAAQDVSLREERRTNAGLQEKVKKTLFDLQEERNSSLKQWVELQEALNEINTYRQENQRLSKALLRAEDDQLTTNSHLLDETVVKLKLSRQQLELEESREAARRLRDANKKQEMEIIHLTGKHNHLRQAYRDMKRKYKMLVISCERPQ